MIQIKEIAALGTRWWFDLFDVPPEKEKIVTDSIIGCLHTFEQQYSRFLDTSCIGKLNTTGTFDNPSDEMISLLRFGKKLYKDTNGIFNFLSAHTQVARGYGASATVRNTDDSSNPADPTTDLLISKKQIMLTHGAVDLGGFGKGWLIDTLARMLQTSFSARCFLINGGGDIYATTLLDGAPVEILVEHPTKKNSFIAKVPLTNQGFGSSGTHRRHWQKNGKKHHHIITAHTDDTVAAHIIAETALAADVFATLACATPPPEVPNMLEENNLEYLLIQNDGVTCSEQFKRCLLFQ